MKPEQMHLFLKLGFLMSEEYNIHNVATQTSNHGQSSCHVNTQRATFHARMSTIVMPFTIYGDVNTHLPL